jgi:hypothetical protein
MRVCGRRREAAFKRGGGGGVVVHRVCGGCGRVSDATTAKGRVGFLSPVGRSWARVCLSFHVC